MAAKVQLETRQWETIQLFSSHVSLTLLYVGGRCSQGDLVDSASKAYEYWRRSELCGFYSDRKLASFEVSLLLV